MKLIMENWRKFLKEGSRPIQIPVELENQVSEELHRYAKDLQEYSNLLINRIKNKDKATKVLKSFRGRSISFKELLINLSYGVFDSYPPKPPELELSDKNKLTLDIKTRGTTRTSASYSSLWGDTLVLFVNNPDELEELPKVLNVIVKLGEEKRASVRHELRHFLDLDLDASNYISPEVSYEGYMNDPNEVRTYMGEVYDQLESSISNYKNRNLGMKMLRYLIEKDEEYGKSRSERFLNFLNDKTEFGQYKSILTKNNFKKFINPLYTLFYKETESDGSIDDLKPEQIKRLSRSEGYGNFKKTIRNYPTSKSATDLFQTGEF